MGSGVGELTPTSVDHVTSACFSVAVISSSVLATGALCFYLQVRGSSFSYSSSS